MNKDIIYIDVEDDITAIIGKIKASRDKIVALVPPKRVGVLQSAVNLRLLARIAETSHKHLVLITNNQALIALSATAKIPVAKNLQSKPEIAEIAALDIDEGEDVIDGSQLPIGEIVKTADIKSTDAVADVIDTIDVENSVSQPIKSAHQKSGVKIPNFSKFRARLFISIAVAPFIIAFFVWAIWFAPAAKIIITAKTSPAPVSVALTIGGTAATDVTKGIIQTVSQQIKKDLSVDFTATGQKDLGVKSSGDITIRNCDYSDGFTLDAGTSFTTNDGHVFVSLAKTSVPKYSGLPSACTLSGSTSGKVTIQVQALASGEAYNNAGVLYTVEGIPTTAAVDAQGSAMVGGTTRMATVVVADDIQKANQALLALSTASVKQQLISQFTNGETVIPDSFTVDRAAAISTPLVDAEAVGGKAKLVSATTFTITAIAKSEIETYLKDSINKQMSNAKSQRIYDDGIDRAVLSGYFKNDTTSTVNLTATGQIGPNIDQKTIKTLVAGMRFGDVQQTIGSINGIDSVDVKFSYFWVNTVPSDANKIDVEFILQNE